MMLEITDFPSILSPLSSRESFRPDEVKFVNQSSLERLSKKLQLVGLTLRYPLGYLASLQPASIHSVAIQCELLSNFALLSKQFLLQRSFLPKTYPFSRLL